MIEISHLVKKYGDHYAVKDLNVRIEEGQIYGFLGPNGAGKSTTMNMITGYLAPTAGTVKVDGFDIVKEPEKAKEHIGYLPEIPPLYSEMTVEEYLKFAAELKRIPGKERAAQIEKAIKTAQLEDVRKRLINNLSKGYKQRVGLAQAVLGFPEIIILDEPTVGLDPNQIIEIRSLIKSLGEKHTIILSSHILSEVNAVCDYVLIIDKGTLVAEDTPEHLSEDFSDTDSIILSVKGDKEKVEKVLKASEYIKDYKITGEKEDIVDVQAKTATKEDIRDNLFFEFAEEKLPIIKMERESLSLEDVFLKLTGQDVEEVESEAKKASEQIEKQSHHGFSFKRKKKAENVKEEDK